MRTTVPSIHHRVHWTPESPVSAWAVALAGLALLGTTALVVAFATGLEAADDFTDNWALNAAGLTILCTAAASLALGLVALVRRHDRSWPVIAATAVGLVLTCAVLGQVAQGLGWLAS